MSNQRFTPEFKEEAVRQLTERGHSTANSYSPLMVGNTSFIY